MAKFYLRIIIDCVIQDADQLISDFLSAQPGITDLHTEPVKVYWKNPGQGELSASFVSALSIEEIRQMLADHWKDESADVRWSRIHVPHAIFIWLTRE
ncbi:MAG: hypothetical protein E7465_10615 [Ruminococcaceae bacterium]|nr:hypothetical protein [Oscillospiraceae bacterium]